MTSLRSWFVPMAVLAALLASRPAEAQAPATGGSSLTGGRAQVHFNFGAQTGSQDLSQQITPIIYDEPATIDLAQTIETGGLIDIGGSYMVYGDFGVGLSYSHTSGDGDAAIAAQIPDPVFPDRPRAASTTATGLDHSENVVQVSLLYRFAAIPKVDVTVGIGPTFFSVSQDLVPTVDVTEAAGGPVITPVVVEGSDSAVGVNISADTTYMITDLISAGVLLRYAKSTAEITPSDSQSFDVRAGGFQIAAGVRVRF
jgi:Outer membrane protein beta-barrel domain